MKSGPADADPSGRLRILLVTDRIPGSAAGYEIRVANVVEGLLAAGDLHLCLVDSSDGGATLPSDDRYTRTIVRAHEPPRWERVLESVWRIPHLRYQDEEDLRARLVATVVERDWDVVWFSRARVHQLCGDLFSGAHVLDLDDLTDRLFTTLAADRRGRLGSFEAAPWNLIGLLNARRWSALHDQLAGAVDWLVVCREDDRSHLGACNSWVVPNGYPVPTRTRVPSASDRNTMLFVGPLTYEPNLLAVRWFVDEVLERIRDSLPDARLSVVGDHTGRVLIEHPAVTYHGFVPEVGPYYDDAGVAVAPLHSGGGTRLKVLEAMAREVPLVSTAFGSEGLRLDPGRDLCVASSASEFAGACVELLTDRDRAARLTDHARATYLAHHQASHSSDAVFEVVRSVASGRHPADRADAAS